MLYTYSNIQQFLKLYHVLMYLCALSDGKNGMDLESYFNINILVKWDQRLANLDNNDSNTTAYNDNYDNYNNSCYS